MDEGDKLSQMAAKPKGAISFDAQLDLETLFHPHSHDFVVSLPAFAQPHPIKIVSKVYTSL